MFQNDWSACTVCGREVDGSLRYGGRVYCNQHIGLFYRDTSEIWRASVVTFGTVVFAIVASVVLTVVAPHTFADNSSVYPGIIVSILPGIVWIASYYRYSRLLHTDLTPQIPLIAIVGVLVAAAISHPYTNNLLAFEAWLSETTAVNRLLGNVLLGGFFHTFIVFAIIRLLGWNHPSFYQRTNGVTLSMAATFGYAGMLGALFVSDHAGLLLVAGNLRIISILCSHIAPNLLLGYFIGMSRFEDLPPVNLVVGFASASMLNGLMSYVASETGYVGLSLTQSGFSPWPGAAICILFTLAAFVSVYGLFQRQNNVARARLEKER